MDELKKQSPGSKKKKQTQLSFTTKPGTSSQSNVMQEYINSETLAFEKNSLSHIFLYFSEDSKQVAGTSKEKNTPEKHASSTSFYSLCKLCAALFNEPSYNEKTAIVKKFLNKGSYYLNVYLNKILLIWTYFRLYLSVSILIPPSVSFIYLDFQSDFLLRCPFSNKRLEKHFSFSLLNIPVSQ